MLNNTKDYSKIYLVQSYPVINNLLNKVYLDKSSSTLIIVVGNKSLELFLTKLFDKNMNVTVKRFGNTNFLLNRYKKIFYPFHLLVLRIIVTKYSCNDLYVTFKDWADFGIIQLKSISSKKRYILNPFEAQQYKIHDTKPKSIFEFLYYLFHRFAIGKDLSLKKVLPKLNRTVPLLGLSNKYLKDNNFKIVNLKKEDLKKDISIQISEHFRVKEKGIIFVEKDLINTGIVSNETYWKFLHELISALNDLNLRVYLKFKPRNYNNRLQKKYERIGMHVLPHHVPLQLFLEDPLLIMGVGFTSSSMAYNKNFKIISFSKAIKINDDSKNKVERSIRNTILRAESKKISFPGSVKDIITEIKNSIK